MEDFEAHPRGTAEEIKLSRALAREIDQIMYHGTVLPDNVVMAYNRLYAWYQKQKEVEKK
jgi:hypothetical protein